MNRAFFNSKIWILIILSIIVIGGFFAWQYFEKQKEKVEDINIILPDREGHPKLESVLYDLTQAKNPKEFAQRHGLDVVGSRVRVVIELINPEYTLLTNFGVEETKYENSLQALIEIEKLSALADDPNIKLIRTSFKFFPQD